MAITAPLRISPSALRSFVECPYKYACDYISRVPDIERAPVPLFAFGTAVHAAIAQFLRAGGHRAKTKDDLMQALLDHWVGGMYPSAENEAERFQQARQMLENFFENPYPSPDCLDLGIERRLAWRTPHRGIIANGKLDRICSAGDNTLLVVDYKTGRPPEQGAAVMAGDFQAIFYRTLAAEHFPQCLEIVIAFHYLSVSETVEVRYEPEEFRSHWDEVESVVDEIRFALKNYWEGLHVWDGFARRAGPNCRTCPMRVHCQRFPGAQKQTGSDDTEGQPCAVAGLNALQQPHLILLREERP